jgi:Na+-transporting methylmalonyl-CoA/oxaloacetate decarboxylase gamma subunit
MDSNILVALKITFVGMGLVFLSIVLLWFMMAILMRLNEQKKAISKSPTITKQASDLINKKRKAAVAAVVVALAREADTELHEFPLPPTAFVSAWQAVNRSDMLKKRGRVR